MTLPVSPNSLSFSQVNVELNKSATALISMNDTDVRTLAGVASGAISINNLYGKSNSFGTITEIFSISASPQNYTTGISMNYDGTRVAIGLNTSAVAIYFRTGSTWALGQTISNGVSQFGYCVSMSHDGNTLFTTGYSAGAVGYIYNWDGNQYIFGTSITIPNNGYYTAVMNSTGDTIFAGCPAYSASGYTNSGRAVIFKKIGYNTWDSGTFVYPPVNFNNSNWWPKTISGDGNWKFIGGNGTTADMGRLSVFDSSNNRYDFPNTVNATSPSVVVCDYNATNVYHTFTDSGGDTCRRYTRSGTTFTLAETITIPPGYSSATNYMRALGISKFGEYSVVGHQYYGSPQNGAFWTYNAFTQKAFKAGDQTGASFGGTYNTNPGGVMSGDGGIIWQLRGGPGGGISSVRFYTYT